MALFPRLIPAFVSGGSKCKFRKNSFLWSFCALVFARCWIVCFINEFETFVSFQNVVWKTNGSCEVRFWTKSSKSQWTNGIASEWLGKYSLIVSLRSWKVGRQTCFLFSLVSSRGELDLCLYRSLPVPARRPQTWEAWRQRISAPHAARATRIVPHPLVFVPLS